MDLVRDAVYHTSMVTFSMKGGSAEWQICAGANAGLRKQQGGLKGT